MRVNEIKRVQRSLALGSIAVCLKVIDLTVRTHLLVLVLPPSYGSDDVAAQIPRCAHERTEPEPWPVEHNHLGITDTCTQSQLQWSS